MDSYKGIKVIGHITITHLLFVNDILIFLDGSKNELIHIKNILDRFSKVTCMLLNVRKSSFSDINLSVEGTRFILDTFLFLEFDLQVSLRYMGFVLKLNDYYRQDWSRLIDKWRVGYNFGVINGILVVGNIFL